MKLTKTQLDAYNRDGFVIIPNVLSDAELGRIRADARVALAEESPRRVLERDGQTVRGVHGQHKTFESFARLVRHPRLVEPCRQILADEVFVYQFKINLKAAFAGELWPWHQDFIFWREEDGLPEPRLVNVAVMVDDNTESNGPLMFLSGSHREGVIEVRPSASQGGAYAGEPAWIHNLTADLKYVLSREQVRYLAARYPVRTAVGSAGSVLLFHPNLVHGSSNNITPIDRCLILVTYNSVLNRAHPVATPRPEFLASRDYTPVIPGSESILTE
jgi:ectoine hydroxylase